MEPRGATEIQHELLEKYVSKDLLDKFQICTSIPGKVPLNPNKINILWQKILMTNQTYKKFLLILIGITNMIGIFLTVIGILKNLDIFLTYQLKMHSN